MLFDKVPHPEVKLDDGGTEVHFNKNEAGRFMVDLATDSAVSRTEPQLRHEPLQLALSSNWIGFADRADPTCCIASTEVRTPLGSNYPARLTA